MPEADIVAARDFPHGGLCKRGEQRHDGAEDDGADRHKHASLKTADRQDNADHARHIECMVTCEKDVFERREARNQNVRHHAERHDERRLRPVLLQGHADDRLIVRYDAIDGKAVLEHRPEMRQCADRQRRTAAEDQNTHDGLDRTLYNIRDALFLGKQPDKGYQTDQDSRHTQDVEDKFQHIKPLPLSLQPHHVRGTQIPRPAPSAYAPRYFPWNASTAAAILSFISFLSIMLFRDTTIPPSPSSWVAISRVPT